MTKTVVRKTRVTKSRNKNFLSFGVKRIIFSATGITLIISTILVSIPQSFAADTGILAPTVTASNVGTWTNPDNAFLSDNNRAVADSGSDIVQYSTFNIPAIPVGSVINGIEVLVEGYTSSTFGTDRQAEITLSWNTGTSYTSGGSGLKETNMPEGTSSNEAVSTYGSSGDNWGRTWASGDFTNANFRLRLDTITADSGTTLNIDQARVRVYYTIDVTAPTIAQVTAVPNPTNDTTPNYTFSSTEAGTIVYGGDCSSADTTASSGNNVQTFNALLEGTHSNCTIQVTDAAGNPSSVLNVNSFTIDTTVPTGGSVTYTDGYYISASVPVTYTTGSDSDSGLNNASGVVQRHSATLTAGTCGSFGSYATIATEFDGAFTDSTVVNGNCYQYQYRIADLAGNTSTYTSTNTAKVDTAVPVFSSVSPTASAFINSITASSDVSYTLSEAVVSGSITLTQTGGTADPSSPHLCTLKGTALNSGAHTAFDLSNTTNSCTSAQSLVSGAVYTFSFDAIDFAGNAAVTLSRADVTFETTAPTVTVNQGASQVDPAGASPIIFDIVFSEPVTGFTASDVSIGGTASHGTAILSGSGPAYSISIPVSTTGTVTASIPAGLANDLAGNPSLVSTSSDNSVQYNHPTHTITASAGVGGTITPSGAVVVNQGASQTFVIAPNTGNVVLDVLVDGASQGRINTYSFSNVTGPHTIAASFDSGWNEPSALGTSNSWNSGATNAYTSNNLYANTNDDEDAQGYKSFNLSIPAGSTINGIQAAAEAWQEDAATCQLRTRLSWNNGTNYTSYKTLVPSLTDSTLIYGGAADTWGHTWAISEFSNTNFVLEVSLNDPDSNCITQDSSESNNQDIFIDQIQVKVSYTVPVTGTLTIVKNTVGGDGSFNYNATGASATSTSVTTVSGTGSKSLTLIVGNYALAEVVPAGWTLTGSSCDSGTPASFTIVQNQTVTCNFNNSKLPSLTVTKVLNPAGDAGKFNLQIDGNTVVTNAGNGGSTTTLVSVGIHTVGEIAGVGTSLANYSQSFSGACDSTGSVALLAGQTATCTITNTRKATLTITKNTTGGGGVFNFNISGSSATSTSVNVPTSSGHTDVLVDPGTYSVSEVVPSGWVLADPNPTCTSGHGTANNLILAAGDTTNCTFINAKQAMLTVTKILVPASDTAKFNLTVDGGTVLENIGDGGSTTTQVSIGTHSVGETAGTGAVMDDYDAVISGQCASGGNVSFTAGQSKSCTITNTKKGHIVVDKITNPSGDTTSFDFTATGSGYSNFNLTDAAVANDQKLSAGSYTLTESALTGWDLTDLVCTDPDNGTTVNLANRKINFDLDPGEIINCTYTNTKRGILSVTKTTTPSGNTSVFTIDASSSSGGTIVASHRTTLATNHQEDFDVMGDKTYSISETDPSDWAPNVSACQNKFVPAGQTVTCNISNTDDIAPVINLTGASEIELVYGSAYTEQGATALDNIDGSVSVTIGGAVITNTTPVGVHQITYNSVDAAGNNAIEVIRTITIIKADANISVSGYSGAYDGAAHGASGTATGVNAEDLSSLLNFGDAFTDVPGGTANWTFAGNTNYNSDSDSVAINITQATSTTVVTCTESEVYTGSAISPCSANVTGAGGLNESVAVDYTNNILVGTANASATYAGDVNHTGSSDSDTFEITKAGSTTVITCTESEVYTGSEITPCTVSVTGAGGLNIAPDPDYADNTNVGTATASYTYAGDANHDGSNGSDTFEITKASSTTVVTCPEDPQTYTGSAQTPCGVSVTGVGGLNFTPDPVYADNTNVGTASASYTYVGDGNHEGSNGSDAFEITKATSTTVVTCPTSETYTGTDITPCSVIVSGAGGLNLTPAPVYADNVVVGTASASYTYAGDANHTGSDDSDTFNITKATSTTVVTCPTSETYTGSEIISCSVSVTGVGGLNIAPDPDYADNINVGRASASYTYVGDDNHTGSSDSETFDINKASSETLVTCPASEIYTGLALTPCTATVTGAGSLNESISVDYTNNTDVGTANASATYAGDSNHEGSSDTETFAITSAGSVTVVTCPNPSEIYTGSAIEPCSVSVTGAGGLNLNPDPDYSDNLNVGTATASYSFTGDANHSGSSDSKIFDITKATSTTVVTCLVSETYTGSAIEICSATVSGVGGLNAGVVVDYTDNINVGTANAGANFVGDSNHEGSADTETFDITKATSTTVVTCPASQTYTGSEITPCSATVTGAGTLNEPVAVTYENNVEAGTATANATYAGDANHTGSSDSETFEISQATVNVTASSDTMVYSGTVPTITASYDPSIIPTTPATCSTDATASSPVSTYASNCVGAADPNYSFTYTAGSVLVTQASSVTVVTCPTSAVYTGSAIEPCTVSITGAGSLNLTPDPIYANNTNVGTANANHTFGGDANHTGSNGSDTFEITFASATVTLGDLTQTYDGTGKFVSVTTNPVGLVVEVTYNGFTSIPVAAGDYAVVATIQDANYTGSTNNTLTIEKANAVITVTPYSVNYDGASHTATGSASGVETPSPADLSGLLNLSATTHTDSGTYSSDAWTFAGNTNYHSTNGVVNDVINKLGQTINFGALSNKTIGDPDFDLIATGGASGNVVTFTASGGCSMADADTVHLVAVGSCTVTAHQAGNTNYNDAADAPQAFTINDHPAPVITDQSTSNPTDTTITVNWTTLTPATSRVVYGEIPVADGDSTLAGSPTWGYPSTTPEDSVLTTDHHVMVTGLTPGHTYYFRGVSGGSPEKASLQVSNTTTIPGPTTGSLKVNKVSVGGDATFSFTGDNGIVGFNITTISGNGSNTINNLSTGNYNISEGALPQDWQQSGNTCVNVPVVAGQTAECTVTNTKQSAPTATLTVTKILSPTNDSGKFYLTIDGTVYANNVGNGGTTGAVTLSPGIHTAGELAGSTSNLNNYTTVFSGDCNPISGNLTLAAGQNASCIITNTRKNTPPGSGKGKIKVVKNAIGGNGTFSFTGSLGSFSIKTWFDSTGDKTFSNLPAGNSYTINETPPSGWTLVSNTCVDIVAVANQTQTCVITNQKNITATGKIRGEKFEDKNGNGQWDNEDVVLSGWTVYLDLNNNGSLDNGEPTKVTDSQGVYLFENLAPGVYHVREVQKPGFIQTYPQSGQHVVNVKNGKTVLDTDFGNFKLGKISGQKYEDKNGNGQKNSGENGLSGWTIRLLKNGNVMATTTTDQNGNYTFTDLGPGTYSVREVQKTGWQQKSANPPDISVKSGTQSTGNNFGNKRNN